jgi:hypothetical protein
MLILDNISYAHSRLNVHKPRKIIAAMADPYDVREYAEQYNNDGINDIQVM